jgi:hypothetical protein
MFWRNPYGSTVFVLFLVLQAALYAANPALTLEVSNEIAPAGGWAQIKIRVTEPLPVAAASIVMDLDPSVFGNISEVAVFSADGGAYGFAGVSGRHLDAKFFCGGRSSGRNAILGQIRNLPVLVVTVAVLPSAPAGTVAAVTLNPSGYDPPAFQPWKDPDENPYDVAVIPGSMTVGGSFSVRNVAPGGGILPAGTVLHIQGLGFTPSTTVRADDFIISAARYTGPEDIEVTLEAPTELTAKRFVVQNADRSEVEHFSSLRYRPDTDLSPHFLFPAQAWPAQRVANLNDRRPIVVAIQNPNLSSVDVTIQTVVVTGGVRVKGNAVNRTIPAGSSWVQRFNAGLNTIALINSSGPIQALQIQTQPLYYQLVRLYPSQIDFPPLQVTANPSALYWQWQIGSPVPPSKAIALSTNPPSSACFNGLGRTMVIGRRRLSSGGQRETVRVGSRNLSRDDHCDPGRRFGSTLDDSGFADRNRKPDASDHCVPRASELQRHIPRTGPAVTDHRHHRERRSRRVFRDGGPVRAIGESSQRLHPGDAHCFR